MSCGLLGPARWLLLVSLANCMPAARAADVETRDFTVAVDGKRAGEAHMTIQRQDDGAVSMRCDTDITVKIAALFKAYSYSYRGHETWKDGRLQRFESTCNDDGKRFTVTAVAESDGLTVRVNNTERKVRADVWLTSYWQQPEDKLVDKVVPLLDADCGRDLEARVQFIASERRAVAGAVQEVRHYRLTGKAAADLWYDAGGRLVRQEWLEDGHRTQLELVRVRR